MTVRDLWQEMVRLVMVENIDLDAPVYFECGSYTSPVEATEIQQKYSTGNVELYLRGD